MIDSMLNSKIVSLAPKHLAKDLAPDTYESLARHSGIMVVWSGGSDNTIYGDARVNHAFRAWHDALHIKLNVGFDLQGETRVALEQARILGGPWAEIIMAEVVGQAEYFAKHGEFPKNQVEFIVNYLKGAA